MVEAKKSGRNMIINTFSVMICLGSIIGMILNVAYIPYKVNYKSAETGILSGVALIAGGFSSILEGYIYDNYGIFPIFQLDVIAIFTVPALIYFDEFWILCACIAGSCISGITEGTYLLYISTFAYNPAPYYQIMALSNLVGILFAGLATYLLKITSKWILLCWEAPIVICLPILLSYRSHSDLKYIPSKHNKSMLKDESDYPDLTYSPAPIINQPIENEDKKSCCKNFKTKAYVVCQGLMKVWKPSCGRVLTNCHDVVLLSQLQTFAVNKFDTNNRNLSLLTAFVAACSCAGPIIYIALEEMFQLNYSFNFYCTFGHGFCTIVFSLICSGLYEFKNEWEFFYCFIPCLPLCALQSSLWDAWLAEDLYQVESRGLVLGIQNLCNCVITASASIASGFLMEIDTMFYIYVPIGINFLGFLIAFFSEKKYVTKNKMGDWNDPDLIEPDSLVTKI